MQRRGISTCSLVPLAALQLSPYTQWGTLGGEGKRVPFPWARGEDTIPISPEPRGHLLRHQPLGIAARCSAGPLRSHACLVQATPAESHQWQPSPSGFLNLSLFAYLTSLGIDLLRFFCCKTKSSKSGGEGGWHILSSDHQALGWVFFPIVNLIRVSCFILFSLAPSCSISLIFFTSEFWISPTSQKAPFRKSRASG